MRHPSPDAVSKLAAVFVVDPTFMATTDSLRAALNAFLRQYNTGKTRMRPGEWAANYLVKDATETNFEKTPCTYHYRYKRFL